MSSASLKFRLCFVVGLLLPLQASGCTFPSDLTGAWITSSRSTLTFTSTTFTPWTVTSRGSFTFTCHQNNGSIYISKSNSFTYIGLTWYAYLCMDLNAINSNAFYYNLGSTPEADAGNNKVKIFTDGTAVTQDQVCDDTNYKAGTYDVMVKSGAASAAASSCPTSVQAKWVYSFDAGSGNNCTSGSYMDVCTGTSTMMTLNYTLCSAPVAYSASGSLYCIHSSTSGSNTYLSLYNTDTTTDESSTYQFTCMVITTTSTTVYVTQYPQKCADNQNSTVISSPGAALTLQNPTSCITTTTTTATSTTPTTAAPVSSASTLGVGLGVTFALLCIIVIAVFLIWYFWKENKKSKEKTRGDKDLEDGPDTTRVEKIEKMEKAEEMEKVEHTPVDLFDGSVPPDVLPRDTPLSPRENGRPTTSGSIHVCLPPGDESERDDKSMELISEEIPNHTTSYSVVGVHPGIEDTDSGSDSPMKSFAPHKGIVPKGAVSLGNGTKPRSKVGKRNKLSPVEGKQLPPIVEDTTPRLNTPRGSISGIRRKLGQKGTVGIQETTTESGSESLPGQPQGQTRSQSQRRGPVKLRQMRSQRVLKKPGPDKPERKVRTRSNRNNKASSVDDEDGLLPSTPVRVMRVDIPSIKMEEPKNSPRNKRSDLKIVDMDVDAEKHVPQGATLEENPDYPFTAPRKKSWLQEGVPTEHAEVWSKVSNMWKLGQMWTDKIHN